MRIPVTISLAVLAVCLGIGTEPVRAQTAATAAVVGTITDQTGAVVGGARVQLIHTETNARQTQISDARGQYSFPAVQPGTYTVTVEMQGFRSATIPNLVVNVAKSYLVNVKLQLGAVTQTVEVQAAATVELQTTDAQLGNVVGASEMSRLPTLQHNAAELVSLQPTVNPAGRGSLVHVAGAMDDQNTMTLDGFDISDNYLGNTLSPWIPIPLDSVEEFRVGVTNPSAGYGRASGGQFAMVGRRGTNDFHGAVYWYTQNDELNANEWENNRTGIRRAEMKDNRGGFRFGGPFWKNRTWFFTNYEIRRFPQALNEERVVPRDTMKAGTLQFLDSSGRVDAYKLQSVVACGPAGSLRCDPRGLGISPSVQALWKLMPEGNDPSLGDGLNTEGYRFTASDPLHTNYVVFRLDHGITSKLHFSGSYTYYNSSTLGGQVSIVNGDGKRIEPTPIRAVMATGQATYQLTPTTLDTVRVGWVTSNTGTTYYVSPTASAAELNIPGTMTSAGPIALNPGNDASTGSFLDAPIDNNATNSRYHQYSLNDYQFGDDLNLVRAGHTLAFGADIRYLPILAVRTDKVVGSISSLIAVMDSDVTSFLSIPGANRPPTCGASLATNCLTSGELQTWDRLYAATLGLVDNVSILAVRNGALNPEPYGTPLENNARQYSYYFYGQDSWRWNQSLTFTYGLGYGWQTPPVDNLARQTILIKGADGTEINAPGYLAGKLNGALQGQTYNPQLAYLPLKNANGRQVTNIDWGDLAPRVSVAWNPSVTKGWLGKVIGDRRSVLRAGYSLTYDRLNQVQSVTIPMLGVGFGQTINVPLPSCDATEPGGANCNPSPSSVNPGLSSFRVGQDGTIPLPTRPAVTVPVVPSVPFGELLSFQDDPNLIVGRSHDLDVTVQREVPGNMLLELGWIGQFASHLPNTVNLDNNPYFFVDPKSGQTFAQAYDAVATELRRGQPATSQPWFEDELPGLRTIGAPYGCKAATSSTACLAANDASAFVNGLVSNLFLKMDEARALSLGLPSFDNLQSKANELRTYIGSSNYNALVVTLHKRASHGLSYDFSYTFSKILDDSLADQNSASYYRNNFYPGVSYGPDPFDRTHAFTGTFVYNLPAGQGHRFHFTSSYADKLISGWYTSGIFTAYSGVPLLAVESSQVWGAGTTLGSNVGAVPTVNPNTLGGAVNTGITGSSTVATTGNPAKKGTGLNIFSNPAEAFGDFQRVLIGTDGRDGSANPLFGLGMWNLDLSLGKTTSIRERVNVIYTAQFLNIFNHVNFANPPLNLTAPQNFGVITSEFVPANRTAGARWIEMGLRVEF